MTLLALGTAAGALLGVGYAWRKSQSRANQLPIANINTGNDLLFAEPPPVDVVAKKFHNPADDSGLQLTLYQYQPCPFCKKVRAFLDYQGLSYQVVEVNPVTKKQMSWTSYKKVPVLVATLGPGQHQQLNDSSVIISTLYSYLIDGQRDLLRNVKCYPTMEFHDDDGKRRTDIMNRYFIMFGDTEPDRPKASLAEERKWRKWADDVLMHSISPNIYRTWDESLEAFNMFSQEGDWEKLFSTWERLVVIYVGAAVMYLIGKRLKKRHNLLDDVRQSLYQQVNHFLATVKTKGGRFLGGAEPNLADLAVYGCLNSMQGTRTFDDLLANTKAGVWYNDVRDAIDRRRAPRVAGV